MKKIDLMKRLAVLECELFTALSLAEEGSELCKLLSEIYCRVERLHELVKHDGRRWNQDVLSDNQGKEEEVC